MDSSCYLCNVYCILTIDTGGGCYGLVLMRLLVLTGLPWVLCQRERLWMGVLSLDNSVFGNDLGFLHRTCNLVVIAQHLVNPAFLLRDWSIAYLVMWLPTTRLPTMLCSDCYWFWYHACVNNDVSSCNKLWGVWYLNWWLFYLFRFGIRIFPFSFSNRTLNFIFMLLGLDALWPYL